VGSSVQLCQETEFDDTGFEERRAHWACELEIVSRTPGSLGFSWPNGGV